MRKNQELQGRLQKFWRRSLSSHSQCRQCS